MKKYLLHYFEGDGYTFEWFDDLTQVNLFIEENSLCDDWIIGIYDATNIKKLA